MEIKKIDLSMAKKGKDFGKGFYVTKIRRDAQRMADEQGRRKKCAGVVSVFEFDYDEAFSYGRYKTKVFEKYTKEWLDFIVENRNNKTNHGYDIVEGPIANDVVNQKLRSYLRGKISAEQFIAELQFSGSHQICFCTVKSLDTIERIDLEPHDKIGDIGNFIINHLKTNDNISERIARGLYYESETYKKVSDENTELYKKNWEEILNMLKKEIEGNKTT
jgi:hypothetical protein